MLKLNLIKRRLDMNRIYIVEFLEKKKKRMISFFTGLKYYHTGMIIEHANKKEYKTYYFCDLSIKKNESDYAVKEITFYKFCNEYKNIVDIFLIPKYFTNLHCEDMLNWWQDRKEKKYSIQKLVSMANTKWILKFSRWYYRMKGEPYSLKIDKPGDVCSVAVDMCLKEAGNYDLFPEFSERIVPPGLFAKRLKENKINKD